MSTYISDLEKAVDALINSPYNHMAVQQAYHNQLNSVTWPGNLSKPSTAPPMPLVQMQPLSIAIQSKVAKLSLELPMRVVSKIKSVDYFQDPSRFVVVFSNNRMLEFCDVDVFPSDEHIARIALEAP